MINPAHVQEFARLVGLLIARAGVRPADVLIGAAIAPALRGARARLRDARQDLETVEDHLDKVEEVAAGPPRPPAIRPM